MIGSFCAGLLCDGSFCDGSLSDGTLCRGIFILPIATHPDPIFYFDANSDSD